MIAFTTVLQKFKSKGEKTGWTYIDIPKALAHTLKSNEQKSFRVKGKIDSLTIKQVALLPMGEGDFIMAINANMRKQIGKVAGDAVHATLTIDTSDFIFSEDFLTCLDDEPKALETYNSQPPSHQKYFSNWIESAKTSDTKAKRIAQSIQGLAMGFNYGEMIRYFKGKKV